MATATSAPSGKKFKNPILGVKVKTIRTMTRAEMDSEGWDEDRGSNPIVIVFQNGAKVYASRDPEGNGPGALFGEKSDGTKFYVA